MLSCYHYRSATVHSREDADHVIVSQEAGPTASLSVAEISYEPEENEAFMEVSILKAREELEEARRIAAKMKQKLAVAQQKLREVKRLYRTQQDDQFLKMHDILFNEVPHYKNSIPELCLDVVEAADQVGSYEIHGVLGEGGFATVYRVRHERTGTWHAMKRLDKGKIASIEELSQVGREIQVMRQADHANVLRCTDVIHASKNIYLIMDLGAVDLWGYMLANEEHVTESFLSVVMLGLLEGIEFLHYNGIAHCDLKPENILLARDVSPDKLTSSDIIICDFGLCQISPEMSDDIQLRYTAGTEGFFSPEMMLLPKRRKLNRNAYCEGRVNDMWSIGVILMELLGHKPLNWDRICGRHNNLEAYVIEMEEILFDLEDCHFHPHSGFDLMLSLLSWDPSRRPLAMEALLHPWIMNARRAARIA